jgi:hypothetical protein
VTLGNRDPGWGTPGWMRPQRTDTGTGIDLGLVDSEREKSGMTIPNTKSSVPGLTPGDLKSGSWCAATQQRWWIGTTQTG